MNEGQAHATEKMSLLTPSERSQIQKMASSVRTLGTDTQWSSKVPDLAGKRIGEHTQKAVGGIVLGQEVRNTHSLQTDGNLMLTVERAAHLYGHPLTVHREPGEVGIQP